MRVAVFPPGVTGQATTTYERMDDTVNTMMAAYANGATETSAAQYAFYADNGKVLVRIVTPDAATMSRIRTWFTSQSLYMPPESEFEAFGVYTRYAMVPVSKMAALTEAFPTTYLSVEAYHLAEGASMNRRGWPSHAVELAWPPGAGCWWRWLALTCDGTWTPGSTCSTADRVGPHMRWNLRR